MRNALVAVITMAIVGSAGAQQTIESPFCHLGVNANSKIVIKAYNSFDPSGMVYFQPDKYDNLNIEGIRIGIESLRQAQTSQIFLSRNVFDSGLKIPNSFPRAPVTDFQTRIKLQQMVLNDYRKNLPVYRQLSSSYHSGALLDTAAGVAPDCPTNPLADETDPDVGGGTDVDTGSPSGPPTHHPCNFGARWDETCNSDSPPVCHTVMVPDSQCP